MQPCHRGPLTVPGHLGVSHNEDTTLQKDDKDGWYRDKNNNLILPATLGRHLCEHLHTTTHLGERKTLTLLQTACLRFP